MQSSTTRSTANQPNRTTSAQANRAIESQTGGAGRQSNTANKAVVCRKCKSQQVVANKRGYSFANMFKTLGWMGLFPFLLVVIGTVVIMYVQSNARIEIGGISSGSSTGDEPFGAIFAIIGVLCGISMFTSLPVSILVGFAGRSEIVNGCMNCGFKWRPAKRK